MPTTPVAITYIGGPTALIEIGGVRLLTDPTFDPGGSSYPTGAYTLEKSLDPALAIDDLGRIDAVLLSHDHHFDNLDRSGRAALAHVDRVLTTTAGAERLGPPAIGLAPWQERTIAAPNGKTVRVTATPARHGPEGGDRGPVIGFVLAMDDDASGPVYVTGDTVWYEGIAEVSRRFPSTRVVVAFMGAANVAVAGPDPLTLTAADGVKVARAFPDAVIAPVHFEGWAHFTEGKDEVEQAFRAAGLEARLRWLTPGVATAL
jgi:L-ascorbate metabolism protein UlaG (beta-lactamase superfamily)